MQRASGKSSIFPILLEQVFQRFSNVDNRQEAENILLDLNTLLGKKLVQEALHLIDLQTIVIYTNKPKTIEIAEITETLSPLRVVRLFTNLNYCTCSYFEREILGLSQPSTGPYTCKHVLALRLALALEHKCLEFKEVLSQQLDSLLAYFLPEHTDNLPQYADCVKF